MLLQISTAFMPALIGLCQLIQLLYQAVTANQKYQKYLFDLFMTLCEKTQCVFFIFRKVVCYVCLYGILFLAR